MADSGQATLLVSLDLSAAFDTIILISRLQLSFGISGPVLSYLHNRSQSVHVGQAHPIHLP